MSWKHSPAHSVMSGWDVPISEYESNVDDLLYAFNGEKASNKMSLINKMKNSLEVKLKYKGFRKY